VANIQLNVSVLKGSPTLYWQFGTMQPNICNTMAISAEYFQVNRFSILNFLLQDAVNKN
jgi:hypothetical protein